MFSDSDLEALCELNRLRVMSPSPKLRAIESEFSARFETESRLAVYGSLAPGQSNHHHLATLQGQWVSGLVARGDLLRLGWGDDLGYPALRWSISGSPVPVELFISPELVHHWPRLDRFEGPEYARLLVPLFENDQVVELANLYAAASS